MFTMSEATPAKKISNRSISRRKYKLLPAFTAVILVFSVIGLISTISFLVSATKSLIRNDKEKAMFEREIYPVMMFDPINFNSYAQLDEVTLLQMCMWSALINNRGKYSYDEFMLLTVPSSDIDVEAKKLFGENVTLVHQTFYDNDILYQYTPTSSTYSIPMAYQSMQYTPDIQKIQRDGNFVYLTVDYIPPSTLWDTDLAGDRISFTPEKSRIYVLKNVDGEYIITAVCESLEDLGSSQSSYPEESFDEFESSEDEFSESSESQGSEVSDSSDISSESSNESSSETSEE